jgi:hypothetical protein
MERYIFEQKILVHLQKGDHFWFTHAGTSECGVGFSNQWTVIDLYNPSTQTLMVTNSVSTKQHREKLVAHDALPKDCLGRCCQYVRYCHCVFGEDQRRCQFYGIDDQYHMVHFLFGESPFLRITIPDLTDACGCKGDLYWMDEREHFLLDQLPRSSYIIVHTRSPLSPSRERQIRKYKRIKNTITILLTEQDRKLASTPLETPLRWRRHFRGYQSTLPGNNSFTLFRYESWLTVFLEIWCQDWDGHSNFVDELVEQCVQRPEDMDARDVVVTLVHMFCKERLCHIVLGKLDLPRVLILSVLDYNNLD